MSLPLLSAHQLAQRCRAAGGRPCCIRCGRLLVVTAGASIASSSLCSSCTDAMGGQANAERVARLWWQSLKPSGARA